MNGKNLLRTIGGFVLAASLLFGVAIMSSTAVQAQHGGGGHGGGEGRGESSGACVRRFVGGGACARVRRLWVTLFRFTLHGSPFTGLAGRVTCGADCR